MCPSPFLACTTAGHKRITAVSSVEEATVQSNRDAFSERGLLDAPVAVALARAFFEDAPDLAEETAAESAVIATQIGPERQAGESDGEAQHLSRFFSALHRWFVARCAARVELVHEHSLFTEATPAIVCHIAAPPLVWTPIVVWECCFRQTLAAKRATSLRAYLRNVYLMAGGGSTLDVLGVVHEVGTHSFEVLLYRDSAECLVEVPVASGDVTALPRLFHVLRYWCEYRAAAGYTPVLPLPRARRLNVYDDVGAGRVRKLFDYRDRLVTAQRRTEFSLRFLPDARLLIDATGLQVAAAAAAATAPSRG